MSAPHFIVHDEADTVGVIVAEDIVQGMDLNGWVMETDARVSLAAKADIPLGHKISLRGITSGDTIIKYGHDIGKAVADIPAGGHAHVHNIKTKKW